MDYGLYEITSQGWLVLRSHRYGLVLFIAKKFANSNELANFAWHIPDD